MKTFKRRKSFFSSGENGRNMKRKNKCVVHGSELIRRHTLDRARIMFVTELIRDTLTSLTPRIISTLITLTYLATGKMQVMNWVYHNLL